MSWWQKKLLRYGLRYGLSRTGLLDDKVLDLDHLDITIGSRNVIELKDVGLNIERISKLAQLPPGLYLETARVVLLKLTIPADFYQSSITAEVDGVELVLRLEDEQDVAPQQAKARSRSPISTRTPQHRKTNRRIHSPPPFGQGDSPEWDEDVRIPTTQEVAKSFLRDESFSERKELEASVAADSNSDSLEESILSEGSEGGDVGTGMAMGLPGFLANFLQGLVDRFVVDIKNVEVRVDTSIGADLGSRTPVAIRLGIGDIRLDRLDVLQAVNVKDSGSRRSVQAHNISLDLIAAAPFLAESSNIASSSSVTGGDLHSSSQTGSYRDLHNDLLGDLLQHSEVSSSTGRALPTEQEHSSAVGSHESTQSVQQESSDRGDNTMSPSSIFERERSTLASQLVESGTMDPRFGAPPGVNTEESELEIQPGDDNISWGSRRSQSSAPAEDLWSSMASQDDLPDSLLIEPERAATPRAYSSRGHSPSTTRSRRAVSPYDRGLRGPGSWPTLDESPRQSLPKSPQSWPKLDESQHSSIEPLAQVLDDFQRSSRDNKKTALETASPLEQSLELSSEGLDVQNEDLMQSRFFSHDEAQSMYMSAMSAMTSKSNIDSPGEIAAEAQSETSTSTTPELQSDRASDPLEESISEGAGEQSVHALPSGNITPRPQTPRLNSEHQATSHVDAPRVTKQLLFVDSISALIPSSQKEMHGSGLPEDAPPASNPRLSDRSRNMPGTFSAYSELSSSHRRPMSFIIEDPDIGSSQRDIPAAPVEPALLDFGIGQVSLTVDIATVKLLYKITSRLMANLQKGDERASAKKNTPEKADPPAVAVSVSVKSLSLSLCHALVSSSEQDQSSVGCQDKILGFSCEHLFFSNASAMDFHMGTLRISLSGMEILSMSPSEESTTGPHALMKEGSSIAVRVSSDQVVAGKRPVREVTVDTSPIKFRVNTVIVEQTLDVMGGLNGLIELSNSFASEKGPTSPATSTRSPKGVRFAATLEDDPLNPELKLNARIAGLAATLHGSQSSVVLRTTSVKAVYRELGAVATVEHVYLDGPYDDHDSYGPPISIDLASLRVEYLVTPQDKDLERLLALLTPSKDKYENDDDILIDTLLRQRRKGSLLRLSIGLARLKLDDWSCSSSLTALGDELTKLSAVAKYLPEDERPGLLTLCRVKDFESQIHVNDRFGNIRVTAQDFHLAHVGLPALLAFSVGAVKAHRNNDVDLVHHLLLPSGVENLPMIMARMLGDEADPSIKIKLFNVCVEYSPSLIVDLDETGQSTDIGDLAASLTQSVADLAANRIGSSPQTSSTSNKTLTIDLLVHDSALGLTPAELSSKALFVLTDAHFTTKVPPGDVFVAKFDFRNASIFLTDSYISRDHSESAPSSEKGQVSFASGKNRVLVSLSHQGYVSVVSIMSASVGVRVRDVEDRVSKAIEVDIKNELLLLETCADSTQTLISTLGALAPPSPPSIQPRYLTEPMTIEDMMASFTGDAVEERVASPETLFDADAGSTGDLDIDIPLEYSTLVEDADGLLAESEMTSSLYGPISGVFGSTHDQDVSGSLVERDGILDTAESLLEEDPFEMTISPEDMPLSDTALMRSLAKQGKPVAMDKPVDIELYEIEDLGFDALTIDQNVLGAQHSFSAPHSGQRRGQVTNSGSPFPLVVKLRDFHVIWNMYDGYDWQWTRHGIADAVEQVEQKAEERRARRQQALNDREDDESVIGDFLFNSIYIGVPAGNDVQELRRQINRGIDDQMSETESVPVSALTRPTNYSVSGPSQQPRSRRRLKLSRSRNHKIAFELKGVSADIVTFPPGKGDIISSINLRLRDFEIFDNVPSSTWRKFLTHLDNDPASREMSKPMFHIEIDTVKTLESHSASELTIRVSVLPLRLHVDQDALDFITRFFEFKDARASTSESGGEQPFLQRVEVETVDLCLDYKPKYVDYGGLRSGRTKEFMNFITLDAANIRLKHAIVYGLRGFDTLHDTLNNVWMPDVTRNQLPTVLAGLAPVRSLVNIGSGVRDVVAIPIREYQKDGRIVRSIQKGAYQFGKTTASELARLGAKVALGTQTVLSTAEEYLSPVRSPSARPGSSRGPSADQGWQDVASDDEESQRRAVSAYANQPLGVLAGLRSARRYLEHDLLTAKDALIAVQGEVLESRGPGAAAAAVAKHAPTVILRPVIGATRAVGTTLLGVGNQIDRSNMRRVEDKYKRR